MVTMTFEQASNRAEATYDWVNQLLVKRVAALNQGNREEQKLGNKLAQHVSRGSFLEDTALVIMDRARRSDQVRAGEPLGDAKTEGDRNLAAVLANWVFNLLQRIPIDSRDGFTPFISALATADLNISNPRSDLRHLQFGDTARVLGYNEALKANNTLFELVVGVSITTLTEITEFDDPDKSAGRSKPEFRFILDEKYWAVECKTVESQLLSVLDLAEKAWGQVGQPDSKGKHADVGLAIINLSRLLPSHIPKCGPQVLLEGWLQDEMQKLHKVYCDFPRVSEGSHAAMAAEPALSGFLAFAQVPAAMLEGDRTMMVTISRTEWWSASCSGDRPESVGLERFQLALGSIGAGP